MSTKSHSLPRPSEDQVRRLERMVWLPFGFAAFLSLITIAPVFLFASPDAGLTAFICFTPMTIFFVCVGQLALSKRISRVEAALPSEADDDGPGA